MTTLSIVDEASRYRRLIERQEKALGRTYQAFHKTCHDAVEAAQTVEELLVIRKAAPAKSLVKRDTQDKLESLFKKQLASAETLEEVKRVYLMIPRGFIALLAAERRWLEISSTLDEATRAPKRRTYDLQYLDSGEYSAIQKYRHERLLDLVMCELAGANTIPEIFQVFLKVWNEGCLSGYFKSHMKALGFRIDSFEELMTTCRPRGESQSMILSRFHRWCSFE